MTRTKEEITAAFVKNHAVAEKALNTAYKAALKMAKDVEEGIAAGMVSGLDAKSFIWEHRAAPGKIAEVAANLATLHKAGTSIAQANGVDLGRIETVGGVTIPIPEFSTMGGGDR